MTAVIETNSEILANTPQDVIDIGIYLDGLLEPPSKHQASKGVLIRHRCSGKGGTDTG